MRTTARRSAFAVAGLLALAPLSTTAAHARPIERYHYDVTTDPSTSDGCGFSVTEVDRFTGDWMVKDATPKTDREFFRVLDRYSHTFVLTNTQSGAWITILAQGVFREGPATIISPGGPKAGPTVVYRTKDSGANQTVIDSDGRVLLRDRGTITMQYTFDTGGDKAPGGGVFLSADLVGVAGPHPLFDMTDEQFCAALTTWIG